MTSPTPLKSNVSYPYLPLDPSTHEIRLLQLTYPAPGSPPRNTTSSIEPNPDQAYTLTLTHATLLHGTTTPAPVKFSALSYVWGSPHDTLPLVINPGSHAVQVTRNLHSAITRLARQRWAGTLGLGYIWIDALCINQTDTAEKNVQVLMMSRIYSLAEEVLVWLGPEADAGGLYAVGELGALFREQVRRAPDSGNGRIAAFVKTVLQWALTDGHGHGSADRGGGVKQPRVGFDFEAIWRLFRARPWWRRVWIIQEVVLARKAVVLCGADPQAAGSSASWDDVSECIRLFEWMVLYPSTAPEYRRLYALLADLYPNVSHLALASDGYRQSVEEAQRTAAMSLTRDDAGSAGMPLLDTIIWTSLGTSEHGAIQATDPRDRIYGLLGMVREDDRRRIPVDYSSGMTVHRVLFAVGKALLHDHGPDLLSYCQRTSGHSSSSVQERLPSWVPDWTAPRMIPLIGGASFGSDSDAQLRGNASNGVGWRDWVSKCQISDAAYEQPVVTLMGIDIARVEKVGEELKTTPGSPDYLDHCRNWLLEISGMVQEGSGLEGASLDEIWRVPMADFGLGKRVGKEDPSRFIHGFDVLTGKLTPPQELENDAEKKAWIASESWDYRRVWKLYERRALIDDAGRPGLGPKGMKVGDRIVVLAGGHVPFILRKEMDTIPRYRVLGPVYAFGLMDGEGVTDGVSFGDIQLI